MHTHEHLINRFYSSFKQRDYAGMIACYHPDIQFSDPVFTLSGKQVGAMWHMLCQGAKDFRLTYRDVQANDETGSVHWEARYTFSSTGRPVHNILDASFKFRDGKIVDHRDHFSFWRWSRQALGPVGLFLGWTPMVRKRVQATAAANLAKFIQSHAEYQ
jgi:ketosteroid isomerase-like protein